MRSMLFGSLWCVMKRKSRGALVNLSLLGGKSGVEFDFPEGALVLAHVLLQDGQQCFGLLWTKIDSLKILYFHFLNGHRLQTPEDQEKVPYAHANLHGVGISVAIICGIRQANIGLRRNGHGWRSCLCKLRT